MSGACNALHWRTKERRPFAVQPRADGPWVLKLKCAPFRGAKTAQLKVICSTHCDYNRSWPTRSAALAASSHFKNWVDYEMGKLRRHAQAQAIAARAPAATHATQLPQRWCERVEKRSLHLQPRVCLQVRWLVACMQIDSCQAASFGEAVCA